MVQFSLNGRPVSVDADPQTPLLWVLRESLDATGTKFGCGIGLCGACTVHLRGEAVRSCVTPLAAAEDAEVVTIEGLSEDGDHPLQRAWITVQAPQCGYCQSGQIMAAASLLERRPRPTDDDIDEVMTNLCRCMAYPRIRRAIHLAADAMAGTDTEATSDA
jgi:isoquinoline 1-oxidoreductase alpha subunit